MVTPPRHGNRQNYQINVAVHERLQPNESLNILQLIYVPGSTTYFFVGRNTRDFQSNYFSLVF